MSNIFATAEAEVAAAIDRFVPDPQYTAGMMHAINLIKASFKEAIDLAEWAPAC